MAKILQGSLRAEKAFSHQETPESPDPKVLPILVTFNLVSTPEKLLVSRQIDVEH
jgi:hypothetical protein